MKFFLFFLVLFFLGRSLLIIFNKFKSVDEIKIFNLNIYIFYPVFGLIFLGNYLFIFNFFLPIGNNLVYIFLLLLFANFLSLPKITFLKTCLKNFPLYALFLVPSYNISYNYDAGLYHLGFQTLLRQNNIILGTSNIYGPFGVSSIYDYISSILWFDETFVYFQFLNLIFVIFLYEFLLNSIKSKDQILKNITLSLIIFSILDNFGIEGGRNGFIYFQGLGKQDIALAVLFLLVSIFIFFSLNNDKLSKIELSTITIFSIFIVQLKISGSPIILFYLYFLYKASKENKINFPMFSVFISSFIVVGLWVFKSILQTGCIIYPLVQSCFENFDWTNIEYIEATRDSAVMFSNSYNFGSSFFEWLSIYFNQQINYVIIGNFFLSFLVIRFIFFKMKNQNKIKFTKHFYVLIFLSLLFYLYYGPDSRYLIGLQMLLVSTISFSFINRFYFNDRILVSLIIISAISLIRLDSYRSFDFFYHPRNDIPVPEIINFSGRTIPKVGDQCWAEINCSANRFEYEIRSLEYNKKVILKKLD